jgi:hypothetical protein
LLDSNDAQLAKQNDHYANEFRRVPELTGAREG